MTQMSLTQSTSTTSVTDTLDPLGRVISRTGGAQNGTYAYLGLSEDPVQVSSGGSSATYSWSGEGALGVADANGARVFLRDVHGDVLGELRTVGAPQDVQRPAWYSPFGERDLLDSGGPSETPGYLRFQSDATLDVARLPLVWLTLWSMTRGQAL